MTVTVGPVVGLDGDPPSTLQVTVTASGCRRLQFSSPCFDPSESLVRDIAGASPGPATETFEFSAHGCSCGDPIEVTVTCLDGSSDGEKGEYTGTLTCGGCPTVTSPSYSYDPDEPCVEGAREVTVTATVEAPATGPAVGLWGLGEGEAVTDPESVFVGANQSATVEWTTMLSPPGPYTVQLEWNADAHPDCDPVVVAEIDALDECDPDCPTVTSTDVSWDPDERCVDGTRAVTLEAVIEPPDGQAAFGQWTFGDGEGDEGETVFVSQGASAETESTTHRYAAPGSYTATLTWDPEAHPDCPPVELAVGPLPECPRTWTCPSVTDAEASWDPDAPCVDDCRREVTLEATVEAPADEDAQGHWAFGDDSDDEDAVTVPPGETAVVSVVHRYESPGSYTARLVWDSPADCPDVVVEVGPLEACCPTLLAVDGAPDGPCTNGTRPMRLTAETCGSAVSSFVWDFGDGESETTAGPTTTHAYTSPGTTVTVSVTLVPADAACEEDTDSGTVDIPPCFPPPPPWCVVWFALNVVLLVAAAIAIVVAFCFFWPPSQATALAWIVAIALAVAAVVSLIVWAFFCGSVRVCAWLACLDDTLSVLAIVAAVVALIVAVTGQFACAAGFLVVAGYFGVVQTLVRLVMRVLNCRPVPLGSCFGRLLRRLFGGGGG